MLSEEDKKQVERLIEINLSVYDTKKGLEKAKEDSERESTYLTLFVVVFIIAMAFLFGAMIGKVA